VAADGPDTVGRRQVSVSDFFTVREGRSGQRPARGEAALLRMAEPLTVVADPRWLDPSCAASIAWLRRVKRLSRDRRQGAQVQTNQ
jgi:hypothetical protein